MTRIPAVPPELAEIFGYTPTHIARIGVGKARSNL